MRLLVGESISTRNPKDTYVLCLKVMHGDADGYSTHEIMRVPNDEFDLEELYDALRVIDSVTDEDDQEKIPDLIKDNKKLALNWPQDVVYVNSGDGTLASYEGHWVRYYDKDGHEFSVKVEK